MLTAVNETHLFWKLINSADDSVLDRMVITQNLEKDTSWVDQDNQSLPPHRATHDLLIWNNLAVLASIVLIALLVKLARIYKKVSKTTGADPTKVALLMSEHPTISYQSNLSAPSINNNEDGHEYEAI